MNTKVLVKRLVVAIGLVCVLAGLVQADKLALQKELGQDIGIQLKDVTIAEALDRIGQEAGVTFVLSGEAEWKLPQGKATRLSVTMDGPLAESITEMLNVFFMRYAVGDEQITIYPRPELEHILGRPTAKQLELLRVTYTRPIRVYFRQEVQKSINEALGQEVLVSPIHVHAQLNNLLRQLVGKDAVYSERTTRGRRSPRHAQMPHKQEPNEPEPAEYILPTPVTLVQLLSQVASEGGEPPYTRWYISGMDFSGQNPEIRVVDSGTFGRLTIGQKIDVSYEEQPLDNILQDLASRGGAKLLVEAHSYLNEHRLSVNMQNIAIDQAVIRIADMVGATCEVRGSEIRLRGPGRPKAQSQEPEKSKNQGKSAGETYVGKMSIPMDDGEYFIEFMLRERDLTEELKELRATKMKEILRKSDEPAEKPEKRTRREELREELRQRRSR
jgi:hypothetical protein